MDRRGADSPIDGFLAGRPDRRSFVTWLVAAAALLDACCGAPAPKSRRSRPTTVDLTLAPARILGGGRLVAGAQILSVRPSEDGHRLAVNANDGFVVWFDLGSGERIARIAVPEVMALAAYPRSGALIAVTASTIVRLAPDRDPEVVATLTGTGYGCDGHGSDDGELVVVVRAVRVYPGEQASRIEVFRGGVLVHAFPVDTSWLAGLDVRPGPTPSVALNATALSADGARLAAIASVCSGSWDGDTFQSDPTTAGVVAVWDLATGRRIATAIHDPKVTYLGNDTAYHRPDAVVFSPDGERLVLGRGPPRVLDAATGALVATLPDTPVRAERVAFVGPRTLLGAGNAGWVTYDVDAGTSTRTGMWGEPAFVIGVRASLAAGVVAVVDDTSIRLLTLPELTPKFRVRGHTQPVLAVVVDAAAERVVSIDGAVVIGWDGAGRPRFHVASPAWSALALSPDGSRVSVPLDGRIPAILDTATGAVLERGQASTTSSAWTPSGRLVHVTYEEVDRDGHLAADVIVAEGPAVREIARVASPYLRCVPVISADGRFAVLSDEETLFGWDLDRREVRWQQPATYGLAAPSPDGRFVAALHDGLLVVHDGASGAAVGELGGTSHDRGPAVAWSPAPSRIAVADGADALVYELDLDALGRGELKYRTIRLAAEHAGVVSAIASSPGGRWVATGGSDGRIALFDLSRQEP